ncbi:hypothetical protein PYV61_08225, partial [Roseisolibacter sp. H3M3-2]
RRAGPSPDGHRAPFVKRVLGAPGTEWVRHAAPGMHVHAPAGSRAADVLPSLAAQAGAARVELRRLLAMEAAEDTAHLELLAVDAREQMRPFTGGTPGGWAEPAASAVLFVTNDSARAPLRHELTHVLSWQRWGTPRSQWISEGLAMHAVGRCGGRALHAMAASLAAEGRLAPLADLPRRFHVEGESGAAMYVQAGSVVRHVAETGGVPALRALWSRGLGADLAAVDRAWRARVGQERVAERWERIAEDVRARGCE